MTTLTPFADLKNTLNLDPQSSEDVSLRQLAKRRCAINFIGRVCELHPKLEGARYISNGMCVACHRETSKKAYHAGKKKRWAGEPEPQAHKLNALWPAPKGGG